MILPSWYMRKIESRRLWSWTCWQHFFWRVRLESSPRAEKESKMINDLRKRRRTKKYYTNEKRLNQKGWKRARRSSHKVGEDWNRQISQRLWLSMDKQKQSFRSCQSQKTRESIKTNQIHVAGTTRGKTCANKSGLVLVSLLIGRESGVSVLNQLLSVERQNQSEPELLSTMNLWKSLYF